MKNTRKLGFLIGSWDAPGAPGLSSRHVKNKGWISAILFCPGS